MTDNMKKPVSKAQVTFFAGIIHMRYTMLRYDMIDNTYQWMIDTYDYQIIVCLK